MTTSSTSCSTSQSARRRRSVGVVPTFWRSKWKSPSTSTSATTTASIFLWTSIPAIRYGIGLSLGERRACLVASVRVAGCRRSPAELDDAQLFGQSRTLRIKQLLGLDWLHWLTSISPLPRRYSDAPIFIAFRGPQAQVTSCGNRPVRRASPATHIESMVCCVRARELT